MKLFHKVLFITLCIFSFQIHAQESQTIEPKCPNKATHYLTHLGTDLASRLAFVTFVIAGIETQKNSGDISTTVPIIGGLLGLFLIFKTPKWTDKYLLNNDLNRSFKQEFLTFLHRVFVFYPLCTMTGEYFHTGNYLS